MKKPKITTKKRNGDDTKSWSVYVNGQSFINGLPKREVSHFKKLARKMWKEQFGKLKNPVDNS